MSSVVLTFSIFSYDRSYILNAIESYHKEQTGNTKVSQFCLKTNPIYIFSAMRNQDILYTGPTYLTYMDCG